MRTDVLTSPRWKKISGRTGQPSPSHWQERTGEGEEEGYISDYIRFWTQPAKDDQKMYKEKSVYELRVCVRGFIIILLLLLLLFHFTYSYAINSCFVFVVLLHFSACSMRNGLQILYYNSPFPLHPQPKYIIYWVSRFFLNEIPERRPAYV